MRYLLRILIVAALLASIAGSPAAVADTGSGEQRVIVVFKPGATSAAKAKAVGLSGGRVTARLALISAQAVTLPDGAAVSALRRSPAVQRVDRDIVVTASPGASGKGGKGGATQPPQVTPWGITQVKADQAWATSQGGLGVKVAIVDTGIDLAHPDLKANIKGGYNAINPNRAAKDDNGHGTHVAGTVAARNDAIGVVGVAPSASLYAVKVLGANGSGWLSDVIEGIQWSTANGMQVINMSLGASSDVQAMHDAVIAAKSSGVTVVAAAGNDYGGPVIYPAAYPEAIAVSATDQSNGLAAFSNIGSQVDLADPGVGVYSTYKGSSYATMSGTSMATPHVSGSAALVIGSGLAVTPDDVKARLETTAVDLGPAGWDIYFGSGLVDNAVATTP